MNTNLTLERSGNPAEIHVLYGGNAQNLYCAGEISEDVAMEFGMCLPIFRVHAFFIFSLTSPLHTYVAFKVLIPPIQQTRNKEDSNKIDQQICILKLDNTNELDNWQRRILCMGPRVNFGFQSRVWALGVPACAELHGSV